MVHKGSPQYNLLKNLKNRTKLSIPATIVVASLIFVVFLTLLSGIIGTSNNPCTRAGCHGSGVTEHVNLLPSDAQSSLPLTFQVGSGTTVKIAVEVVATGSISSYPAYYKINLIKVTLSSLNGKVTIQNGQQQVTNKNPTDKVSFQWSVSGASRGDDTLIFDLWANNTHKGSEGPFTFTDSYQYGIEVQDKPSAPQSFDALAGDGYVELTWELPLDDGGLPISGFKIFKGTSSGTETLEDSVIGTELKYNDTSVTNGQTYYYYATAVNSLGESVPSTEVSATPLSSKSKPFPPINLVATPGKDYVSLSWDTPLHDGGVAITQYKIYRGETTGSGTIYNSVNYPTTEFNDTSVSNGVKYYYFVSALNSIGESDFTSEVSATPDSEPPTVKIKSPPDNTYFNSKSISIEWSGSDSISGLNHFEVKIDNEPWFGVGLSTFHTIQSVSEGKHTVSVKAIDNIGNTNEASVNIVVDLQAPKLKIISPVNNSKLKSSSVTVEWNCTDPTSGIEHYEIRIDGYTWQDVGKLCSYEFTSLPDGQHTIELKAVDNTFNVVLVARTFFTDATKPTALSYAPTGDNVQLDSVITITFSEEMNESSVKITVSDIQGNIEWNDNELTLNPELKLEYNTEYFVEVSGSDLIGNMLSDLKWSFKTKDIEKIIGIIVDVDGEPVSDALITIDSGESTNTNENGAFTINAPPGEYDLTINRTGYKDRSETVDIKEDKNTNLGRMILQIFESETDSDGNNNDGDGNDSKSNESSTSAEFPWVLIIIIIVIIALMAFGYIFNRSRNQP